MDTIEIRLLKYTFKLRRLSWLEEYSLKFEGRDARRVLLASALTEISGLKICSFEDAYKTIKILPSPILNRVFVIYKGGLPKPRNFTTLNLYCAPEPRDFQAQIAMEEEEIEREVDKKTQVPMDDIQKNILKMATPVEVQDV